MRATLHGFEEVLDKATSVVQRFDWIGWIAIGIGVIWALLNTLGLPAPFVSDVSSPVALALLGFISLQVSQLVAHANAQRPDIDVLLGNEEIHRVATNLVRRSTDDVSMWTTSLNFRDRGASSEYFRPYFEAMVSRLRHPESEWFRAVAIGEAASRESLRSEFAPLLELPHKNWRVKYFRTSPLTLDILVSDDAAMLAFPQRATYPHLAGAVLLRDKRLIEILRDWYRDYVWHSEAPSMEPRTIDEFNAVTEGLRE